MEKEKGGEGRENGGRREKTRPINNYDLMALMGSIKVRGEGENGREKR
jgi:hypothetical protein